MSTIATDGPSAAQLDQFSEGLHWLLHASANRLVRDAAPGPYLDWMARHGASIGAGVLPADMRGPAHAADASRLMRLMGHMIYAAMPLPQHRFQMKKLPLPGRNDPCLCGSLHKFKQCCEPMMVAMPKLTPEMGMSEVLDAMGKKAWRELPAQKIAPSLITAAAHVFRQEQRLGDVTALLEPWAAEPGRLPAAWAELLDMLGDAYADLDKPRKRKALAEAMIERGEPAVQSKGWQRLCLMLTDAGKYDDARTAFGHAQRLAPDDPALSLLEVSMLLGFGQGERASERARFHAKRLQRVNVGGDFDDLIDMLDRFGERGADVLAEVAFDHAPELRRLDTWLAALPAPLLRIDLERCSKEDLGEFVPVPTLAKLHKRWQRAFVVEMPSLVSLQAEASDAWRQADRWLALLEAEPALGDSFDVLDGLLLALEAHPSPAAASVARRVIGRALGLWSALRDRFPRARSHWAVWPNRPAMRLLAQHIVADPTPDAESSYDWLKHLVEVLNPNDNHGFRSRLALVYLRRGLSAEALALTARYADDTGEMTLARVLALWHGEQRGAATSLLAETLRANAKLAKVMRSTTRPEPSHGDYITVGSVQEAQRAYADQFDLWQGPALREVIMAVSRRSGRP